MILNEKKFCEKRNSEIEIFRLVRFRISFFTTPQISNWIFDNVPFFECTSLAEICQIFIRSSKQGTFRQRFNVWYGFGQPSYYVKICFVYPNSDQRNTTYYDNESDPIFFINIRRSGMLFNKILLKIMRFATYRDNNLISMTHLRWRLVLWPGREPTWSSIEVGYREWWLMMLCAYVLR